MSEIKISFVRDLAKFFIVLFAGIAIYCALFPFLKEAGVPNAETLSQLDPFLRATTAGNRVNTMFLYISGCIIFMSVLSLYCFFIFPRALKSDQAIFLEGLCGIGFLFGAWTSALTLNRLQGLLFLAGRLAVPIVISLIKVSKMSTSRGQRMGMVFVVLASSGILFGFGIIQVWVGWEDILRVAFQPLFLMLAAVFYITLCYDEKLPLLFKRVLDGIFVIMVFILTLSNDVHYFDFSNFICAINDVALGKDILQNVISQYGFLNIYFLAGVFKIFQATDYYAALSIVNSIFYFIAYVSIYLFLRNYTKRVMLSILAVASIIFVNFYMFLNVPVHWVPSVGFLRFGTVFLVLALLLSERLRAQRYWGWLLAFSIALALFWVIEVGIYILAAFFALSAAKYFLAQNRAERTTFIKVIPKVFVILFVFVLFITAYAWFKYQAWPVWNDLIYYQKYYLGGMGSQSVTHFHLWPAVLLIYFTVIYLCVAFYGKIKRADTWLFLSFFGLTSFLYYMSLMLIDHLARICLPATFLFFICCGFLLRKGVWQEGILGSKLKYGIYAAIVLITLSLGFSIERFAGQKTFLEYLLDNSRQFVKNAKTGSLEKFMPKDKLAQFQYDTVSIKRLVDPGDPLVIISKHDTLYHFYAQKKSFFKIAFYPNFSYSADRISQAVQEIIESPVQTIFIDNSSYQCYSNLVSPHLTVMQALLSKDFRRVQSLGLLDVYERNPRR